MATEQTTTEVTTAELRQILAEQTAYVFDARPYLEYAISHIPGSLTVASRSGATLGRVDSAVDVILRVVQDKRAPVVLYGNGPFCVQSKGLAGALVAAGFTNVRRYQLGIPTWRALVGVTQVELAGARYVFANDKSAVWVDARRPEEFAAGTLPNAVNLIDKADIDKAEADQRLPMHDHNTRIIVFGQHGEQAQTVAVAIAKLAFHHVSYFTGDVAELQQRLQP